MGSMRSLYNHACLVALVAALLSGVACTRDQPRPSGIVERVQQAGAGDVAAASAFSLDDWMRKHRDLAVEVEKMCVPAREKADAQWGDTTEGKVCVAARNAAMSTYRSPRDGKGYHSGNK
jgi:hypothetical protein